MNHAARISHSPCVQFQFQVQFRCEGGTNAAEAWGRRNVLCDETRQPRENTMNSRPPSTRPTSFPMGRVAGKSAPGLELDQAARPGTAASLSSSKVLPGGQA